MTTPAPHHQQTVSHVGPGAVLRDRVLGDTVCVEASCSVAEGAVIGRGCRLAAGAYVGDGQRIEPAQVLLAARQRSSGSPVPIRRRPASRPRGRRGRKVKTMSMIEDVSLTGKVKAALLMDERIGATGINVNTTDGVVTLEGVVASAVQRELAEDMVIRHGAHEVRNRLEVHGGPAAVAIGSLASGAMGRVTASAGAPPSDRAALEDAVRHALAADRRVNEHVLELRVENNEVFLTGRQDTVDARDAAVETSAHVPGVVAVDEDIEIMPSA
jgi:osmotically-inducible protein OsmY